jgi:WD40 repeat protein
MNMTDRMINGLIIIGLFLLVISCNEQVVKLNEEQLSNSIAYVAYPHVDASGWSSKEIFIVKAEINANPIRITYNNNWEEQPVWIDNGNLLLFMRCCGRVGSGKEIWYLYKKILSTGKEERLMEIDWTIKIKSSMNLYLLNHYYGRLYSVDILKKTLHELLIDEGIKISSSKWECIINDFSVNRKETKFALDIAEKKRIKGKILVDERRKCYEIATVNRDGTNFQILTNDTFPDRSSAISPDGKFIAFESERNDNSDIYLIDIATKEIKRLTDHPTRDYSPTWSPDGKKIAFISERDGFSHIWVVNADGTGLFQLTKGEFHVWPGISWSPR